MTAEGDVPNLVAVGSGVWVVEGYSEPVFYSDGYYWRYSRDRWYTSRYLDAGFTYAPPERVPVAVRRIDRPGRYAQYRAPRGTTVRPVPREHLRYERRYEEPRYGEGERYDARYDQRYRDERYDERYGDPRYGAPREGEAPHAPRGYDPRYDQRYDERGARTDAERQYYEEAQRRAAEDQRRQLEQRQRAIEQRTRETEELQRLEREREATERELWRRNYDYD